MPNPIPIGWCLGPFRDLQIRACLFEDACQLREDYRIVGNLTGCLPQKPRQNVHLALPLQLLPEETTLLKELGLIVAYFSSVKLSNGVKLMLIH